MAKNNDTDTNTNHRRRDGRIHPWQSHALGNGRTPLPEAPGERPWLGLSSGTQRSGVSLHNGVPQDTFPSSVPLGGLDGQTSTSMVHVPLTYRFWPEDEMRRLIALRNGGATWPNVYAAFPNRTPEAIKQAYHKRRHAIERQMEIDATEAAAAASTADDDRV